MKKIFFIFSLLLSINEVYAQSCIPKPDCADMGYTKTSCSGAYLKCPFDTTKLACLANSSVTGCFVGMIYYSDGTCSNSVVSGKTAVGVVVKANSLVLSQKKSSDMKWASNTNTDVVVLPNYIDKNIAQLDYEGKGNTLAIVAAYPSDTSSNNAAVYCNQYTTAGTSAGQWYLPAAGELYRYVYGNYDTISSTMTKLGWSLPAAYYWSSSEYTGNGAWYVNSGNGDMLGYGKGYGYSVSCLLAL